MSFHASSEGRRYQMTPVRAHVGELSFHVQSCWRMSIAFAQCDVAERISISGDAIDRRIALEKASGFELFRAQQGHGWRLR